MYMQINITMIFTPPVAHLVVKQCDEGPSQRVGGGGSERHVGEVGLHCTQYKTARLMMMISMRDDGGGGGGGGFVVGLGPVRDRKSKFKKKSHEDMGSCSTPPW